MQKNILVVDDEPNNLNLVKQILAAADYRLFFSRTGEGALKRVHEGGIDLILLDIMMPEMDGYTVCELLKNDPATESIPVIFVTAMSDVEDERKGLELGAVDYVTKPVSPAILLARIKTHLSLVRATEVERTRALIIQRLGRAAEYKDNKTGLHVIRMGRYSKLIAENMGLADDECELVLQAAPMHDIGKIGIADSILTKPARLTDEEWEQMKTHSQIGGDIIGDDNSRLLEMSKKMALNHHEKWDGSGYPNGLSGEDIPLVARIVALADVFDALTTARPYKKAWSVDDTVVYIKNESGSHFDPKLVSIFLDVLPQILEIKKQWSEDK